MPIKRALRLAIPYYPPYSHCTMFHDDDLDPKTKRLKPRLLDNMSVDDLKAYINDMKAEIIRVEADIIKKEAHKNAISGLFKKKED